MDKINIYNSILVTRIKLKDALSEINVHSTSFKISFNSPKGKDNTLVSKSLTGLHRRENTGLIRVICHHLTLTFS